MVGETSKLCPRIIPLDEIYYFPMLKLIGVSAFDPTPHLRIRYFQFPGLKKKLCCVKYIRLTQGDSEVVFREARGYANR